MSKILIIEDDNTLAEMLRNALEEEGFGFVVASEAMQGITLAHDEKPDLILLDLIMLLGDGLTVLRNLKISTHTNTIPIIVISGTSDMHLINQVKSMDIAGYCEKPFDMKDLVAKIKEIVPKNSD